MAQPRLSHLDENRDLAVTTDFRDVFEELLAKRMGISNRKSIFPGYAWMRRSERLGVIAA